MQTAIIIAAIVAATIWLTREIRKAGNYKLAIEKIDAEIVATNEKLQQAVNTAEGKK